MEDLPRGLANAIALEDDAEALLEEPGVATTGDKIYRVANSQLEAALVEAGKDGAPQVIGEFMYPYIEGWATQAGVSDGMHDEDCKRSQAGCLVSGSAQ